MIQIKTQVGTNLRPDHHTLNSATRSYPKDTIVEGAEWFIAPVDLFKSDGKMYQKKGDKWLHVTAAQEPGKAKVATDGWMAVIHMGSAAGLPIVLQDAPPTDPDNPPTEDKVVKVIFYWESGKVEELP